MRIIGTLHNPEEATRFSSFLKNKGISHQIDVDVNTDWSDTGYGDRSFKIWIYEEEQVDQAIDYLTSFSENPKNPLFDTAEEKKRTLPIPFKEFVEETEEGDEQQRIKPQVIFPRQTSRPASLSWQKQPMGVITRYLLFICCAIFFFSQMTTPSASSLKTASHLSILRSPIEKTLLYDYPHAFDILDKIVKLYGLEKLEHPSDLPYEGQYLLKQFVKTPYWKGFYEIIIANHRQPVEDWHIKSPMFEKIQDGQIWRLASPILLHADIFHLFFNMLWLIVLGKQIEQRIGPFRYLLFILIAAIISDTAQYLMSGPNFMGISGVLMAMLSFMWMRQKRAPWEGYQLQKATFGFIMVFILGMFGLQVISFILEIAFNTSIPIGIANTAHLTGAGLGVLFGKLDFFSWKT